MNTVRDTVMLLEKFNFDTLNAVNRFIQREFHLNVWHVRALVSFIGLVVSLIGLRMGDNVFANIIHSFLFVLSFIFCLSSITVAVIEEAHPELSHVSVFSHAELVKMEEEWSSNHEWFPLFLLSMVVTCVIKPDWMSLSFTATIYMLYAVASSMRFDNIDKGERRNLFESWFSKQEN